MTRTAHTLRILAFEPFDAGSHRAVRESIARHSRHHWLWFTLPGRFWKWRMRTAAIELLDLAANDDALNEPIDCIFLTSLMSAADLRALLPDHLRNTPIVLYMHENQAVYPAGHISPDAQQRDIHFPLTNLTSILAADCVIWNSRWNRDSFLNGIDDVLRLSPDAMVPDDLHDRLERRSTIIWPPVEPPPAALGRDGEAARILHNAGRDGSQGEVPRHSGGGDVDDPASSASRSAPSAKGSPIRIAWPHRWEHDKGPDEFLALARAYTRAHNLRWTILGEQYRTTPDAMQIFERDFTHAIDHIGYEPDRKRYWQRLAQCDWVLSTAQHEFFGIAVVEALFLGCLPWLPNRLSYPELLPQCAHGLSPMNPPHDPDHVRSAIDEHLQPAIAPNSIARLDRAITSACQETT